MEKEDKVVLMLFAKRLKMLREKKFESLNQFAFNNSELTSATISRIENANVDFKFTTLIKISNALGITPDELLKDIDFKYSGYNY
ncbi:helix-turn-helix transcriptional regulator [bacterium]|nr:helix-turn-helix transcriptional regulator [bacterium]